MFGMFFGAFAASSVIFVSLLVTVIPTYHAANVPAVIFTPIEDSFRLENGYILVEFDPRAGGITTLSGDFSGLGQYGSNLLTAPFSLQVDGKTDALTNISIQAIQSSEQEVVVVISGITSSLGSPIALESWKISLRQAQRSFDLDINGIILQNDSIMSLSHSFMMSAPSIYGFFERGVFQMMGKTDACLGSDQHLSRAYALGAGGSLDLAISTDNAAELVFYSASKMFSSGIQHVIKGNYPRKSLKMEDAWSRKCWENATTIGVSKGDSWQIHFEVGLNNMDFPTFPVRDALHQPNMPELDLRSFLTGIYASPPGCLQSYYQLRDGTISPTIATPDYGYSPNTNFFDPDNFISISAMLFSGDTYLANEVRKILERTAETMCGIGKDQDSSYCGAASVRKRPLRGTISPHPLKSELNPRDGQLMHHYINLSPTYESIATSEQLGPNVFWTLSALRYASVTGDFEWLIKMEPYLSLSAHFLLSFFDEDANMLLVPGPLWIDVLVRENYTSDSNAIAPYVFREFAAAFDFLHQSNHLNKDAHKSFSEELRRIADAIVDGMNTYLWDEQDSDHYITQLNHDMLTTRDFIDYDANLLAVAFDVAPADRISSILNRVDRGVNTHIRATWCSEIAYTGDRCDCYIVGGDVCGDSVVTLARIGWADAIARKKIGDLKTFETLLLEPLQNDLIKDTWLYERYDSNGNQIRTAYYFEYPSFVAMMLTEIRYGLELNLQSVTINPFQADGPLVYSFTFGFLSVEYSSSGVSIHLPGTGHVRNFTVSRLQPSTAYTITYLGASDSCTSLPIIHGSTNNQGSIQFSSSVYSQCTILLTRT